MFRKNVPYGLYILISLVIVIALFVSLFLFAPTYSLSAKLWLEQLPTPSEEVWSAPDKIHFLNTGGSDAILLESDGHFAMIDAGEDTDNPRNFPGLELEGYEDKVLEYLKKNAAKDGKVHLDFVLGTHSHSDHIGGFDTIILDSDVIVDRAYLKEYDSSKIKDYEIEKWDNQEVYDQMVNALQAKDVPIVSDLDGTPFALGNFTITLFNTSDPETNEKVGENDRSLGVLVEKNGTRVFLAGDIDNLSGDEDRLAPEIGKVDLLKVGHHSNEGSSTTNFVKTLSPETCVITNNHFNVNLTVLTRFERHCQPDFYVTGRYNGVLAVIGDNGNIVYYGHIQG